MISDSTKSYRSFSYILFLVINASLGAFFFGYKLGEMNLLLLNLQHLYSWSSSETTIYTGLLNALIPIGAIIGAILSGNFFTMMGRRWGLISADIIGIIGSFICIFIGSIPYPQIIGRFISGISAGVNSQLVPLYINEMSPIEISGFMGSFFQAFLNFGILTSYLMGLGIPEDAANYDIASTWWIWVFLLPVITCVIRAILLMFYYKFDTPFSLMKLKKEEDIANVLKKLYKSEFIDKTLEKIEEKIKNYQEVSFHELFTRYKSRLLLGIVLMASQQLSGVNAVVTESSTLYSSIGDTSEVKILTIMNSIVLSLATFISGVTSDKFGRRAILLYGSGFCVIFLFLMAICEIFTTSLMEELAVLMTFCFLFGYGVSLGPIPWLYNPEILPDKGISLTIIVNMAACGLVVFLTPIMITSVGISPIYFFFGGVVGVSQIYFYFAMKETKGKNCEEIDELFLMGKEKENDLGYELYKEGDK